MKIKYYKDKEVYQFHRYKERSSDHSSHPCDICGWNVDTGYIFLLQKLKRIGLLPGWYHNICCSCAFTFKHSGLVYCTECGAHLRPRHIHTSPDAYVILCSSCGKEYEFLDEPIKNWYEKIQDAI